jgi:hypothetical protein
MEREKCSRVKVDVKPDMGVLKPGNQGRLHSKLIIRPDAHQISSLIFFFQA